MATTNTSPFEPNPSVLSVDTAGMGVIPTQNPAPASDDLYKTGLPEPKGINPEAEARTKEGQNTDPTTGTGVESEIEVWQARYSQRNFIGQISLRVALTIAVMALTVYFWNMNYTNLKYLCWAGLAGVALVWLVLGIRMIQAYFDHFYQLTNRRLFVATGLIHRRRDMMELLMVQDVYTRQESLLERWLNLGTVVVVPGEKTEPTFYLTGVNDPKEVMDLIWHHARAERDQRSLKIQDI